jgi:hypothetical protein
MIGRTAFLAPLMVTSPRNGVPPRIKSASMDQSICLNQAAAQRACSTRGTPL